MSEPVKLTAKLFRGLCEKPIGLAKYDEPTDCRFLVDLADNAEAVVEVLGPTIVNAECVNWGKYFDNITELCTITPSKLMTEGYVPPTSLVSALLLSLRGAVQNSEALELFAEVYHEKYGEAK